MYVVMCMVRNMVTVMINYAGGVTNLLRVIMLVTTYRECLIISWNTNINMKRESLYYGIETRPSLYIPWCR